MTQEYTVSHQRGIAGVNEQEIERVTVEAETPEAAIYLASGWPGGANPEATQGGSGRYNDYWMIEETRAIRPSRTRMGGRAVNRIIYRGQTSSSSYDDTGTLADLVALARRTQDGGSEIVIETAGMCLSLTDRLRRYDDAHAR